MADPYELAAPRPYSAGPSSSFNQQVYLVLLPFILIAAAWLSYQLLQHYQGGDLSHYRRNWLAMRHVPLGRAAAMQWHYIGSLEPLYAVVAWWGSRLTPDHDLFMAGVNVLFVLALLLALRRYDVPVLLLPLVLSNFYLLVLLSSAERLKIASLFVLFYFVVRSRVRLLFLLAAPFAHLQHALVTGLVVLHRVIDAFKRRGRGGWPAQLAVALLCIVVVYLFTTSSASDIAAQKVRRAMEASRLSWIQSAGCFAIALALFRHRPWEVAALGLVAVTAMIIGGDRVNMIAALFLLALFFSERRALHPVPVVMLAYFSYKSVAFLQSVWTYGDGFLRM